MGLPANNQRQHEAQGITTDQKSRTRFMEALEHLAGYVHHDLNNIQSAMLLGIQLLERENLTTPDEKLHLTTFIKVSERIAKISHCLKTIKGLYASDPDPIDLNGEISHVESSIRYQLKPGIQLRLQLGSQIQPISSDRPTLHSLLTHLVSNAQDAMGNGGILTISTEPFEFLANETNVVQRGVLLLISDTGTGIEPSVQECMFEPFFTTKDEALGLGLTAVYGMVKQMGGQLAFSTEKNKGTTFRIYLPAKNVGKKPQAIDSINQDQT